MLKQTRLSYKILALGYSDFNSFRFFQVPLSASRYQAFNCCSQSECFSQNSRSIFLAITLNFYFCYKNKKTIPNWELLSWKSCFDFFYRISANKVIQGNFTPAFPRNRTWKSPFIRLFVLIITKDKTLSFTDAPMNNEQILVIGFDFVA